VDADGDGFAVCDGDCDDETAASYPDNLEVCDGIDNDCDADTDELADGDGDGYSLCDGDCDDSDAALDPADMDGDGHSTCDGDCNDAEPLIYPGAEDYPGDLIDSDCDGFD